MAYYTDPRTLYVGNLHRNVTEKLLYELFLQAGPVERVSIPKSNSPSFRYGFVTFVHECAIDYSLELYKGTFLYNKKLVIRKKGNKKQDPKNTSNTVFKEMVNKQEKTQSSPAELEKFHPPKNPPHHQKNDRPSSGSTKAQMENQTDVGRKGNKGQWFERYKPYDHSTRRENTSRSENFNKRDKSRNHSHYNKSRRDRKRGRY